MVTIVIPIYKRTSWLQRCLESISRLNYDSEIEVIVVDDGSPDGSAVEAIAGNMRHSPNTKIKLIRNEHKGPAAARNFAVRFSSGDILCFLDDDSIPDPEWLTEITRPFHSSDSIAFVSGKTLSLDRAEGIGLLLESKIYPEKSWATCNIAYRRHVFEALGGFDESFREPSWEDNDLGIRSRWAGYRHFYAEHAIVYHPHEQSILEYKKKCVVNGRGAAIFARKYLLKKPFWSILTPVVMSRRLLYGICPHVWLRKEHSVSYLKFLWSLYSLKGFLGMFSSSHGKN